MIINKDEHKEFSKLMEFIFSFDFSNKDILRNQIQQAVVDTQRTEYSIVHRFFVNSISKPLPDFFNGMPISIDVNLESEFICCELFVAHGYIMEIRIYSINGNKLSMDNFWKGKPHYEKLA